MVYSNPIGLYALLKKEVGKTEGQMHGVAERNLKVRLATALKMVPDHMRLRMFSPPAQEDRQIWKIAAMEAEQRAEEDGRFPMAQLITDGLQLAQWLKQALHEQPIPTCLRNRLAAPCFILAQEHQHAIVLMLQQRLEASAVALMRSQCDYYIRALWLAHCATEPQLRALAIDGQPFLCMSAMRTALRKHSVFNDGAIAALHEAIWNLLSYYRYSRGLVRQCLSDSSTASQAPYRDGEIKVILRLSNSIALLATLGIASLANNELLAQTILEMCAEQVP